jgi:hypothetical protein
MLAPPLRYRRALTMWQTAYSECGGSPVRYLPLPQRRLCSPGYCTMREAAYKAVAFKTETLI